MKASSVATILSELHISIGSPEFVKLTLGSYHGNDPALKNVYVKPVLIKNKEMFSFTYRYQTRDITKNHEQHEAYNLLSSWISNHAFHALSIFLTSNHVIFQRNKNGKWTKRQEKPASKTTRVLSHDKPKERKLPDTQRHYLHALRLTDAQGNVYKNTQDKWKQINHFIELLSTELEHLPAQDTIQVVDMGSGKGYLTFALYDYLTNVLHRNTGIKGIEWREDLVQLCNDIATEASFSQLHFAQGSIADYQHGEEKLHLLMALHACDTATDDAIFKGIQHQAQLIVVAPCCHKQIRRELEKNQPSNDLDFMTGHGIFLERHSEMLTDSMRMLILEYFGYKTKALEFVSDTHTPKNVLIIATFKGIDPSEQKKIKKKLHSLKSYFGVGEHYLEKLAGLPR